MRSYISNAELEELGEGVVLSYTGGKAEKLECIDIEGLITDYLGLLIEYEQFAEDDMSKIGFLANGITPLQICKRMNEDADNDWFPKKNPRPFDYSQNVRFLKKKKWWNYIDARRLEITCGEAPYLVSRYDVSTGESIPIEGRIGLLDHKLRVVNENTSDEEEWLKWTVRAFQSIYGYEFQGDNVLIARVNLLMTFEEYLQKRWKRKPTYEEYRKIANIIVWNIWQMDGLTGTIPYCKAAEEIYQMSFFDYYPDQLQMVEQRKNSQPQCKIYDWRRDNSLEFLKINERSERKMKFDFVIGNPPYQEEATGTSDKPIYNCFMDAAYQLSDKVELIHPARFLFNTGKTPKAWNEKMLRDEHLKVLHYEQDSSKFFPNTSITGGIAITYRDATADFGAIEIFSQFEPLRTLREKMQCHIAEHNIIDIMYAQNRFDLEILYADYPEYKKIISSEGRERRIVSSAFQKLPIFTDNYLDECIQILGISDGKRKYRWIKKKYVEDNGNLNAWKVVVSKSNGASGTLGKEAARIIAPPMICEPLVGYTQTFIGVGKFRTQEEAQACLKYILTKFARALLGILKATQDNPPDRWKYVPLQDFTPSSDIDWSKSVAEIDQQLYAKYGLDEKEIEFIESHVKEMS